jgi:putative oxidoreductase
MSTTKSTNIAATTARILLGLIFLIFGLNFFFHFLPAGGPHDPTSKAGAFLGGLFGSGYFFVVLKSLEVLYGILLILDLFTPLVLVLTAPITVNIVLFHYILAPAPQALVIASILLVLTVFLAAVNRAVYAPLFNRNYKGLIAAAEPSASL